MKEDDVILQNSDYLKYWLSHASADTVFKWLREWRSCPFSCREALFARNEPLINLGLALWVYDNKIAEQLFRNGDWTIKRAVLEGPSVRTRETRYDWGPNSWVESSGVLEEILESCCNECCDESWNALASFLLNKFVRGYIPEGLNESCVESWQLLKSFLCNKHIPGEILAYLYQRSGPFEILRDHHWVTAIECTVSNPNTDYFAWKLFETMPVNYSTARILAEMGQKLIMDVPPDMDMPVFMDLPVAIKSMDVPAAIKRWKSENENISESHLSPLDLKKFQSPFVECRFHLTRLLYRNSEDYDLKNSDDIALRLAYYADARIDTLEELKECFEKDKGDFLHFAIDKPEFYKNQLLRKELRACVDNVPYYSNHFEKRSEQLLQEHPDWFLLDVYDGTLRLRWDAAYWIDKIDDSDWQRVIRAREAEKPGSAYDYFVGRDNPHHWIDKIKAPALQRFLQNHPDWFLEREDAASLIDKIDDHALRAEKRLEFVLKKTEKTSNITSTLIDEVKAIKDELSWLKEFVENVTVSIYTLFWGSVLASALVATLRNIGFVDNFMLYGFIFGLSLSVAGYFVVCYRRRKAKRREGKLKSRAHEPQSPESG